MKLIDGKNFASIALVKSDGYPHVSPVWIDRDGDLILVNTAEGRVKTKNLRKGSKVSLSIYDQKDPYEKVVIMGRVIEMTKKGAEDHIDKMAFKYLGKKKYPYHREGEERVLIRIEPVHIALT